MKNIVILYAPSESTSVFEPVFDGKSAFDKSIEWGSSLPDISAVIVLADTHTQTQCTQAIDGISGVSVITKDTWTVLSLLQQFYDSCTSLKVDNVIFAWADCPFLHRSLTQELLNTHISYVAEYSFADGYPYGFAPEIIAGSTAGLLTQLPVDGIRAFDNTPVLRDSLQSVLKVDINSFEIETVIAKTDWRMYRFSFDCGDKAGLHSCKALYAAYPQCTDVEEACHIASLNPEIVQTVPGFYNVQIAGRYTPDTGKCHYCPYPDSAAPDMSLSDFNALVTQMTDVSQHAVVDLSAWGEPLLHPHFLDFVSAVLGQPGLSLVIETDGYAITEELAKSVADIANRVPKRFPNPKGYATVSWIVTIDAMTAPVYAGVKNISDEQKAAQLLRSAQQAVSILEQYFPKNVYPQMVRTARNEDELEAFYRYWSKADSPSQGMLVIQKYDWFCGLLPNDKPADVSPVVRNPCWHIRRDMTVLSDGSVPLCRECICDSIIGNVFTDGIASVWQKTKPTVLQHIKKEYTEKCSACDEYYTFNF